MSADEIFASVLPRRNWKKQFQIICLLWFGFLNWCQGSSCNVDTTIETFREDVPAGTVILKIPFHEEEAWEFRESYPEGYLDMETLESGAKVVSFKRCPDLEEININNSQDSVIESLEYTLSCTYKGIRHMYKQRIALVDVNEKDPYFTQSKYSIQVNEMTLVGTVIFSLADKAADDDVTGTISLFRLHPFIDEKVDGRGKFSMSTLGKEIILKESLDHDAMQLMKQSQYFLNISVQDNGYPNTRISFATLAIEVLDADDQGPAFVYPKCPKVDHFCATPAYTARVAENSTGLLKIYPDEIRAEDRDQQKNAIYYSIIHAEPQRFLGNFLMNNKTGHINQIVSITDQPTINLIIKAEEISKNRRFITSTVIIQIEILFKPNLKKNEETNDLTFAKSNSSKSAHPSSNWPYMLWSGESISITVFFIIIGSLLLLLMGMTVAIFFAFRDRKQRGQNVTFDDTSSNSTGSSSLGARDTVSTSDVSTATDDSDIVKHEELGSTTEIGCYDTPVTLEFTDGNEHIFDPTGSNSISLPASSSSPKFCKSVLKGDAKQCIGYQKKKDRKSSKMINMLTYSNRKVKKQKEMPGRFNFGIENHWLDMPYDFD